MAPKKKSLTKNNVSGIWSSLFLHNLGKKRFFRSLHFQKRSRNLDHLIKQLFLISRNKKAREKPEGKLVDDIKDQLAGLKN